MNRSHLSAIPLGLLFFVVPLASQAQTSPPNDNLANAQVVTGLNFSVTGTDTYATAESGEPSSDGVRTIWYLWTAPSNLNVTFSTNGTLDGNMVVNAYEVGGTGAPSYSYLNYVAEGYSGGPSNSSVSFPATANTTYAIEVGSYNSSTSNGSVTLNLTSTPGPAGWIAPPTPTSTHPANDNLANAQIVTGSQFSVIGYDGAATNEQGEGESTDGTRTIWYLWTAPSNLNVTFSTNGTLDGNMVVNAYEVGGTGAPSYSYLNYVAEGYSGGPSNSSVSFPATANTTYAIEVGSYNSSTSNGSVELSAVSTPLVLDGLVYGPPPPTGPSNDDFANAETLLGSHLYVIAYNGSATTQVGEPQATGFKTVWYSWTPNASGKVILATTYATFAHQISVFTGGAVYDLSQVGSTALGSTGSGQTLATITFTARAGVTYKIAIGSQSSSSGGAVLLGLVGPGSIPFNRGRFSGFFNLSRSNLLTVSVSSRGEISGEVNIGGRTIKVSGAFNSSGSFTKNIDGVGFQLHFDPAGTTSAITGTITIEGIQYSVSIPSTIYNSLDPAPPSARYTVLIAPDPDAGPPGYGAATLTVLKNGDLVCAGRLADGTAFSTSGFISNASTWTLYAPLYRGGGYLSGLITFAEISGTSDLSGELTWVKPTSIHGTGFSAAPDLIGSLYTPRNGALSLSNPMATLSSGGLLTTYTSSLEYHVNGLYTGNGITMKFNDASGLVTGSFVPPGSKKPLGIYGVAFQDQNLAAGYFIGKTENGSFLFGN